MTSADEIRATLGELASLAEQTETAERHILAAAMQRLAALPADQASAAAEIERGTLLGVIERSKAALGID